MIRDPARNSQDANLAALKRERDRFVALAFCAADILLEADQDLVVTFAAGATKALTGVDPNRLVGQPLLCIVSPRDQRLVAELVKSMSAGRRLDPVAVRLNRPGGPILPLVLTGYLLPELPNSLFFALRLGASGGRPAQAQWPRDEVTGLLDKESFADAAAERLRDARLHGEELMLTMLRLSEFEELRSRLNAEASRSLAETVGACVRMGAGVPQTAARFDDENFGFLHPRNFDVDAMRARIETHARDADPNGAGITVTAGTVSAGLPDAAEEDQIRGLLYIVNRFCEESGETPTLEKLSGSLEQMLNTASQRVTEFRAIVSDDLFDVAFQPIVRIADREIKHYEALARFGGGSDRSPYELITFAENTGMISDFDYAMCRKLLSWIEDTNRAGHGYSVACNLSGRSISRSAFQTALTELLERHAPCRHQLVVEITESARIADLDAANRYIQSLRRAGHTVCLDDFGAGSAALRYLHDLDVDIVKIDGSYIRSAVSERKRRPFLRAITGLCVELGITTVAEMVEDEATLTLVKESGFTLAQGYLFGRPNTDIEVFSFQAPDIGTTRRNEAMAEAGAIRRIAAARR